MRAYAGPECNGTMEGDGPQRGGLWECLSMAGKWLDACWGSFLPSSKLKARTLACLSGIAPLGAELICNQTCRKVYLLVSGKDIWANGFLHHCPRH